ncbi:MAG: ammonium transporter, partial [Verrucomicrobia bacterium]|nr:ammonium transporter [Verrucomicrobiota bacterium]
MKIKKYLLALLISGATLMGSSSLSAQEESAVDEAAVAAATELAIGPAEAAVAAGNDQAEAYLALLEAQGEYAYAFDFFTTSMLWTVIAAALVFLMHLGFATLEAGLTQSKNTVNIMFKNVFIISIGLISYAVIGFNTHYPGFGEDSLGIMKFGSFIGDLSGPGMDDFGYGGVGLAMTAYGDFIFQAMFAATAATIVSGAVAERVKLGSFMIFATLLVAIAYPVVGSWHWGEGWLNQMENPFYDFAGSTVVHAFGGFAALACVIVLGPRAGKYVDGKIKPILGHSMPLATIGVFLLFLGWFGFNGGSVLSADPAGIGLVFTTTALAASAGALASIAISWIFLKKPDLSMALNGILAGLVGITAGADAMGPLASIIVGAVAGVIVVFSIIGFDKIKIDDPVGAISVHGVCGIWGTLAVAFFGGESFASQLIGAVTVSLAAFLFSIIVFGLLKVT